MALEAAEATSSAPRGGALGRSTIFGIVCGAHFINHFPSTMFGVIYPWMMKDLGLGFAASASIAAAYNTLDNVLQGVYRFIVPYVRRGVILGIGKCVLG